VNKEEFGKIGYLTIHESTVQAGDSQRRSGAHTESPGGSGSAQYINGEQNHENGDLSRSMSGHTCWGGGSWHGSYKGGIYMASNVDDSLRVWNTLINSPERVVGEHGDLEHVRHLLGEPRLIKKYEVVWMTDRTPHESVPVVQNCDRQYIRLVTSDVSVWYSKHSTPNPLGIVPPASVVQLHFDKFSANADQLLQEAVASHAKQLEGSAAADQATDVQLTMLLPFGHPDYQVITVKHQASEDEMKFQVINRGSFAQVRKAYAEAKGIPEDSLMFMRLSEDASASAGKLLDLLILDSDTPKAVRS